MRSFLGNRRNTTGRFVLGVRNPAWRRSRNAAITGVAQGSRTLGTDWTTVAKWQKRVAVEDRKTGPREPRSPVLTGAEAVMAVAVGRQTRLQLDDCLPALRQMVAHLLKVSSRERWRARAL